MMASKAVKIWNKVIEDMCECYVDAKGNRPCDYGSPCRDCENRAVHEEYNRRLEEYERKHWTENLLKTKKYVVTVFDMVTYWDIEANTKEEAIDEAWSMWEERRPIFEATEQKD